jgi:putative ABC transport system substrate-binding protein
MAGRCVGHIREETIMKKMSLKKLAALSLAAVLSLSAVACGTEGTGNAGTANVENTAPAAAEKEVESEPVTAENSENLLEAPATATTYKVAIIKQLDHASLDEIANAIAAELELVAVENGVTIEYQIYSGQNDQSTLKQIADQAVAEGVDAIIPIATLAAQVATVSAEETKTPVIFAAISDPVTAELTGIDYVTGTSDALNTPFILDMMLAQNPEVQKVGLLYSLSESNSETPIAEAKAYLDEKGIAYSEMTANTNDEVVLAASSLVAEGVDAIFTPTDNVIMAAELAIYDTLAEAGIPHYAGADSFVRNGAFATCGVNYTDLGTKTADLAYQAMSEGMADQEDFYLMDGGIITVNTETAAALGADYSMFASMGELVEVVTTEE